MAIGVQAGISSRRYLLCAAVETTIFVGAYLLTVLVRAGGDLGLFLGKELLVSRALAIAAVFGLTFYYLDLYDNVAFQRRLELFVRIAQGFAISGLVLAVLFYAVPRLEMSRTAMALFLVTAFPATLLWRGVFLWAYAQQGFRETVLIVGTGQSARQIATEMLHRNPLGYRIVGFVGEQAAEVGRRLVNPSVIGIMDDLEALVFQHDVSRIVVALDDRRGKLPIAPLLRCRLQGVRVEEVTDFFERLTGKILVKNLRPSWLVFSEGFSKPRLLRNAKRVGELLAAVFLLVLFGPLLALTALLIKLDSRGPVFYGQERVGEKGGHFFLYKFRTMRVDAESSTGPVWAAEEDDPRMTRVGRRLRRLRLDELPQILNVVRGEMSFVGPRPERPHFVDRLRKVIPYYDERHGVKPGITGWAQIKFGYGSTIEDAEEKLEFDLYYIKHMSPVFDVGIVLDTLKVMVMGKGAR